MTEYDSAALRCAGIIDAMDKREHILEMLNPTIGRGLWPLAIIILILGFVIQAKRWRYELLIGGCSLVLLLIQAWFQFSSNVHLLVGSEAPLLFVTEGSVASVYTGWACSIALFAIFIFFARSFHLGPLIAAGLFCCSAYFSVMETIHWKWYSRLLDHVPYP